MVVVVVALNLTLLLLVELVSRQNCHLLLEVIVQHLLRASFAGRLLLFYLLALVVVLLVLIVCLITFYEIMFRPSLLNLMPSLCLLLPLSALLRLLYLVIVYLPFPRVVLLFVAVLKNHILLLLLLRLLGQVFLHSFCELHKYARFCVLLVSSLPLSFVCLIFSSLGLSIILNGRSHQKNYPEDLL